MISPLSFDQHIVEFATACRARREHGMSERLKTDEQNRAGLR
jgi:hypothetical protein